MVRLPALDICKGIAISFVAAFHVVAGFVSAGLLSNDVAVKLATDFAYNFHVQIFFIIAGYLSINQARESDFQINRSAALYYPYLLWSAISAGLSLTLSSSVNHPLSIEQVLLIPIWPIQHYWFMLCLLLCTWALALVRTEVPLIVAALVCALLAVNYDSRIEFLYFFPFMALGAILRLRNRLPTVAGWMASIAVLLALAGPILAHAFDLTMRSSTFIWSSLGACYVLYCLSSVLTSSRIGRWLEYVGKSSLVIYLVHVIIGSGARIVLYKVFPLCPPLLGLVICCGLSITLPLVALAVARRLRVTALVGFSAFRVSPRRPS